MRDHEIDLACPRCGEALALTTEWGWIDSNTCTATLACPHCRTETGWSDAAVVVCHPATEAEALAGIDPETWLAQMARS